MSAEAAASQTRPHQDTRFERWLVVVGVVVLAFNLRPAASSVGPVLAEVSHGLGMDAAASGVLTALPVVAFGGFGAMAPLAARKVGLHRVTLLSLIALTAGLLARATVHTEWAFLVLSVIALGGMAVANVLLPSLIKLHFPDRIGLFTALYTTALAIGLTSASAFTVPLADAFGSWRGGLAAWAVTAAIAAAPWVLLVRHDTTPTEAPRHVSMRQVARTRLGWAMALLFGLQSAQAYTVFGWFAQIYRDAGFSATTAGVLLGVVTGISIPLSLVLPILAGRTRDQTRLMLLLIICYPIGYLGLAFFPVGGAWAWALLVGIAASVFPVVLTLIGLRSRTPEGTAALSGFTQSLGYVIAALGPFGIGVLNDLTGGWTWPLLVLTGMSVATGFFAVIAARPRYVEDELATSG